VFEWAGEMIERKWVKASKGGVRPGNQPMGHTAFLLIAAKIVPHEEE
jgi:tRNA A58 N-methylase Trm61